MIGMNRGLAEAEASYFKTKDWHILDIPEGKSGEYQIRHIHKDAGTCLDTANMRCQMFGQPNVKLMFDHPTRWHELSYEGGVWMTDLPIEQAQHDRELQEAHGDVLIGGLGLGYAATQLIRRPEVDSVTVVEISPEVIELVQPHIDDEIIVICADLFEYLEGLTPVPPFDYCFFDIWQSDGEGTFFETVVPLRKLAQPWLNDEDIICWNEDVMRGQLNMALQSRLAFLQHPLEGAKPLTIDMLCEKQNNVYWDWMIPYWKALRDGRFDKEDAGHYAQVYCELVGKAGFEETWDRLGE